MAIEPTPIDELPPYPLRSQGDDIFREGAQAYTIAQNAMVPQVNATAQVTYQNTLAAESALSQGLALQEDLQTNYGTFADQLADLDARLAPLEYGGISILTMSVAPAVAEIGVSIDPLVSWTLNTDPTAQTLNGVALADQVNDRNKAFVGVTAPDPTQASATTYALHVEDTTAPPGSPNEYDRSVQVSWLPRRFWGTSAAAVLDAAGVLTLASSELSGSKAKAFTVDGGADPGAYLYFVYPAYLGDPAGYSINGFGETPVITTVNVTTAAGATLNYKVVRSPNRFAGAANIGVS